MEYSLFFCKRITASRRSLEPAPLGQADAVSKVLRTSATTLEEAPPVLAGVGSEYMRDVGKLDDRLLILLDLDNLLGDMNLDAL